MALGNQAKTVRQDSKGHAGNGRTPDGPFTADLTGPDPMKGASFAVTQTRTGGPNGATVFLTPEVRKNQAQQRVDDFLGQRFEQFSQSRQIQILSECYPLVRREIGSENFFYGLNIPSARLETIKGFLRMGPPVSEAVQTQVMKHLKSFFPAVLAALNHIQDGGEIAILTSRQNSSGCAPLIRRLEAFLGHRIRSDHQFFVNDKTHNIELQQFKTSSARKLAVMVLGFAMGDLHKGDGAAQVRIPKYDRVTLIDDEVQSIRAMQKSVSFILRMQAHAGIAGEEARESVVQMITVLDALLNASRNVNLEPHERAAWRHRGGFNGHLFVDRINAFDPGTFSAKQVDNISLELLDLVRKGHSTRKRGKLLAIDLDYTLVCFHNRWIRIRDEASSKMLDSLHPKVFADDNREEYWRHVFALKHQLPFDRIKLDFDEFNRPDLVIQFLEEFESEAFAPKAFG